MGKRGRPPHPDILTLREWQVLDLLRDRLTNEQIAHRLDISYATAKYHVAEIISKLCVQTREEAAAWQPPPARPWWAPLVAWLRPLTLAKAAIAVATLAAVGGLAILAWGVLRTEGNTDPASVFADLPQSLTGEQVPISEEPLRLTGGIYRLSEDGGSLTHISDEPGKNYDSNPSSLSQGGRWLAFAPAPVSSSSEGDHAIFVKDLAADVPARTVAVFALVYSLAISPDGRELIVHGDVERQERSWPDIAPYYLVDLESQAITPLPWLQSTRDVMWSPEGKRLSFTRPIEGGHELVVSDLHGTVIMRTTIPDTGALAWSPDGTRLALDSYSEDHGIGTYLVDMNGTVRLLTPALSNDPFRGPNWSPDGRQLVVGTPDQASQIPVVSIIDIATGHVTSLAPGEKPTWSRDGTRLAFLKAGTLFVMRADGTEAAQLLHAIQPFVDSPSWAFDDSGILFHYAPGGLESIRVLGADGADHHLAHGINPTWSPDGSQIAFVGRVLPHGFGNTYEVWVMGSDGRDPHKIGEYYRRGNEGCDDGLGWSGDGTRVIYGRSPGTTLAARILANKSPIRIEEGCGTSISSQGSVIKGAWFFGDQPFAVLDANGSEVLRLEGHGATWSPDGSRIAYWKTGEISVADYPSGERRNIANLGDEDYVAELLWSPDGHWLAYTLGTNVKDRTLWVVDVDKGRRPTKVSDGGEAAWSPDSQRIVYAQGDKPFEQTIYVAETKNPRRKTSITNGSSPQWSPDGSLLLFTR